MFRLLEGLEEDEDAWETVGKDSKKKAKQQQPQASSSANGGASTSSAASRPAHNSSITNSTAHLRSLKESALNSIKQPEKSQPPPPQQQQQQNSRTHDPKGKPMGDSYYRAFQRCFVNERTGDVVLRFHKTDIVKVKGSGEVVLTSGGYLTMTTMMSMNDALKHVGIKIKSTGGDLRNPSTWSIQLPNAGSMQYEDEVVIPSRTAADKNRAGTMLAGLKAMEVQVLVQHAAPSGTGTVAIARQQAMQQQQQQAARQQQQQQQQQQLQQQQQQQPPVVHAPQSYAARLAANVRQQQQQQQRQSGGGTTNNGTSSSAVHAAATAAAAAAAGYGADVHGTSNGAEAGGGALPDGPAEFCARSAHLTADAYLKFLSPNDYTAMASDRQGEAEGGFDGGGNTGGAGEGDEGVIGQDLQMQALAAGLSNLVSGGQDIDEDDSLLCVMCMENPQETILIPCSHAVLCARCADYLMSKNTHSSGASVAAGVCPICRTEVMEVINVAD